MSDIYEAELLTEVVKGSGGVELLPATSTRLGGIKVGTNLTITEDGILSASASGGGVTAEVKTALLNCFANVAWINENGQAYYNALQTALNNAGSSGDSGSGDSGDSGNGGDSGGEVTPPSGDATAWTDGVPYEITPISGEYVSITTGAFLSDATWARSDYLPCEGVSSLSWTNNGYSSDYNAFYDSNKNLISTFRMHFNNASPAVSIEVPANASYFVISNTIENMNTIVITPHA